MNNMPRLVLTLGLLVTMISASHAAPPEVDQASPLLREVVARTQALVATIKAGDAAKIKAMIADECMIVTARGLVERDPWITQLTKGMAIQKFDVLEARAAGYGDTVVVFSRQAATAILTNPDPKTGSKDYASESLVTDVWNKRGKTWLLVARQSSPAAK